MKRISIFLFAAALLFVAGNGFAPNHKAPFAITGCDLKVDDMSLSIAADAYGKNSLTHFKVKITRNGKQEAFGIAKLDFLKMPKNSFSLRVPLSSQLKSGLEYKVFVEAYTNTEGVVKENFSDMAAAGSSSNSFFKKDFSPMPELNELRNSIGAISIKREMEIN